MPVTEADLASAFAQYDKDSSGFISSQELQALSQDLGFGLNDSEVDQATRLLDSDGSGKIEQGEFVRWWSSSQQAGATGTQGQLNKIANAGGNKVLDAKRERKRAEEDVQLLMNRLQHLRMEEGKARKKINETEKRAGEIIFLKKRNNDRRLNGNSTSVQIAEQRAIDSAKNHKAAADGRMRRQKAMEDHKERKRDDVQFMRETKKQNGAAVRQQKNAYVTANSALREQIKNRESEVRRQRAADKAAFVAKQSERSERRCAEEQHRTAHAEKVIEGMEIEEEKLIERLRATQDKQRKAYQNLEAALAS